jgi:hypothetical protein
LNLLRFFRHGNGSNRRLPARRPIVEDLEGRRLLSGIQGNHIGIVAEVQKVREVAAAIQGAHIGTNVASADELHCHIHPNVA